MHSGPPPRSGGIHLGASKFARALTAASLATRRARLVIAVTRLKNVLRPETDLNPFIVLLTFSTVSMLAFLIVASLFRVALYFRTASPGAVIMRLTVLRFARCG